MTEPEMTAQAEADLRLVDEALASGVVSSTARPERELEEIALALRAEAPEPSPAFAAELRGRVEGGFRRERRLPRPQLPTRLRRPPGILLAGAASLIVALAVAAGFVARDGDDSAVSLSGSGSSGSEAAPQPRALREGGDSAAAPSTIAPEPPPPGSSGFAPGERRRRIERSASLTLATPGDDVDRTADGIVRVTDRHDGFVLRSTLATGDAGTGGGEFELRIPAARLRAALTDLSKLGDVRSRTQSGRDVTREFSSATDRLQAARAERRSLLRRLERAPSDSAAEAIRRRLDLIAGEIRGLRGEVRELRTRTDYAAVAISLEAKDADGGGAGGADDLGAAVDDALESLGDSVEILVRVLGVAIPLGLVAAGLGLGARAMRRRRREATLLG